MTNTFVTISDNFVTYAILKLLKSIYGMNVDSFQRPEKGRSSKRGITLFLYLISIFMIFEKLIFLKSRIFKSGPMWIFTGINNSFLLTGSNDQKANKLKPKY